MPNPPALAYSVRPLSRQIVGRVRAILRDELNDVLFVETVEDRVPCRSCLQLCQPGDDVILMAHRPFETDGPYAELVVRAYDHAGRIFDAAVAEPGSHEEAIAGFFEHPEVRFLHARNVAYGCFLYQIDRA